MDIPKFFSHSHSDLYPNKVCVYLHLNTCVFIFVDIILEVGLTARMTCLFLILIDVAWLLSGKTEQFHFFFFFVPWGHPLPASSPTTCVIALCLRCGSFMTVKWYLNLTSFPQLSVSSNIYIYLDLKICFWGICLLTSLAQASLVAQW